ncbi:MAG: dTMP kinase, partial [Rhodocyclaceae bacterium]|nr:dTMP kinase [Rhodocyclaceae bacterium]
ASHGVEVVLTREPGGTKTGEQLREILLSHRDCPLDPNTELLMMFAARAQHIAEVIQPALVRGAYVICDRFTDSSFAYQGGGRGVDYERIMELERQFVGFRPALTLLLDAPVEVSRVRTAGRGGAPDRIESEGDDFFTRVRDVFLARAEAEPQRVKIINSDRQYQVVIEEVERTVRAYMARTLASRHVA